MQKTLNGGESRGPPAVDCFGKVTWWSHITFGFVDELLLAARKASQEGLSLNEYDAASLRPADDQTSHLVEHFTCRYARALQASASPLRRADRPWRTPLANALLQLHWRFLLLQLLLCLGEVSQALLGPVVLREFLRWLELVQDGDGGAPAWHGWLLALALGACSFSICFMMEHHHWCGLRVGLRMRQQAVAAIHDKTLRLSPVAPIPGFDAALSPGYISTLIGADVRRFDDCLPYWPYLVASPLQLIAVLVMIGLELNWLSSLAGVATCLAIIPMQAGLASYIAWLRDATAHATDDRVAAIGEAVAAPLDIKTLGLEDTFETRVRGLRQREATMIRRTARVHAVNMALSFSVTVVASFITFFVHRALSGSLDVSSVYYVLSLLQLPAIYIVNDFILGVQYITELGVSLCRLQLFLDAPELQPACKGGEAPAQEGTPEATSQPPDSNCDQQLRKQGQDQQATPLDRAEAALDDAVDTSEGASEAEQPAEGNTMQYTCEEKPVSAKQPTALVASLATLNATPAGYLALRGADYDWRWPLGGSGRDGEVLATEAEDSSGDPGKGEQACAEIKADCNVSKAKTTTVMTHNIFASMQLGLCAGELAAAARGVASFRVDNSCSEHVQITLSLAEAARVKPAAGAGAAVLAATAAVPLGLSTPSFARPSSVMSQMVFGSNMFVPTLRGVNLEAPPGSLLGVCGSTGSGKSSLLAALLGELQPLGLNEGEARGRGALLGSGRVAYCAQVPWITYGTVRQNILFGLPYDDVWYDRVVDACCLREDLAGLPAGDCNTLGQGGAGLSGGQKARVSLARAVYSRPAVALLDDPLSAVDPRVAQRLFDAVLGPGGLLHSCGATRVLVTHQRRFLPGCDQVLVLRAGRVAALGSWQQVSSQGLPELSRENAVQPAVDDPPRQDLATAASGNAEASGRAMQYGVVSVARPATLRLTRTGVAGSGATKSRFAAGRGSLARILGLGMGTAATASGRSTASSAAARGRPQGDASSLGDSSRGAVALAAPGSMARGGSFDRAGAGMLVQVPDVASCRSVYRHRRVVSRRPSDSIGARVNSRSAKSIGLLAPSTLPQPQLQPQPQPQPEGQGCASLLEDEDRETGSVAWSVYGGYCLHLGLPVCVLIAAGMVAGEAAYLAADWWLAMWADAEPADQARGRWPHVYAALTGTVVLIAVVRAGVFFETTVLAATGIHDSMAKKVLHSPLPFFHANPAGRIINRFSKDQGMVDDLLPTCAFETVESALLVAGALVLVAVALPYMLPLFVPLAAAFWWTRHRYITASREIKRWEAVTYSPVYAFVVGTVQGLPTIRAYGAGTRFQSELLKLLGHSAEWSFALGASQRWLALRLDCITASCLLLSALIAVAVRGRVHPQILGLALTHSLTMLTLVQYLVRQSAEVENQMTSVERMLSYTKLPTETMQLQQQQEQEQEMGQGQQNTMKPTKKSGPVGGDASKGGTPAPDWPTSGALAYRDVTATYQQGLPPVLRGLTFNIPAGSSCGVVGRTGSGKSSLLLTVFRLIPVTNGTVALDGVDTARVPLATLRRHLAVIPQDPVLFRSSLRSNLDPWVRHADDDAALWSALRAVQLAKVVRAMPGGLEAGVAEGGSNLSVGQRQLFCLARALLGEAVVLALDEATANLDEATDGKVQAALRTFLYSGSGQAAAHSGRCGGRVVLTVAHRPASVLHADQLLVLSGGELAERGPPGELMARPAGIFRSMAAAAGIGGM